MSEKPKLDVHTERIIRIREDEYPKLIAPSTGTVVFHVDNVSAQPIIWEKNIICISREKFPICCYVEAASNSKRDDEFNLQLPDSTLKYYKNRYKNSKKYLRMDAYTGKNEYILILKRSHLFRLSSLLYTELIVPEIANYNIEQAKIKFYRKDTKKTFWNMVNQVGYVIQNYYEKDEDDEEKNEKYEKFQDNIIQAVINEEADVIIEYSEDFSRIIGFSCVDRNNIIFFHREFRDWNTSLLNASFNTIGTRQPYIEFLTQRSERFLKAKGVMKKYHWAESEEKYTYNSVFDRSLELGYMNIDFEI